MQLSWNRGTSLGRGNLTREYLAKEPPLRAELLSDEQMRQHGKALAGSHTLGPGPSPDKLLTRLTENEGVLIGACTLLTEALTAERRIAPAGDWLLDNFYLIEEQIRTSRRHLPKGYAQSLPRLSHGPSAGLPRVYDLALECISHGDGRVDPEGLSGFVEAYQTVTVLDLGELWAIPIMLRLALIENLRRVAAHMAVGRLDRNRADYWADRMEEVAEKDPKSLILATADMARSEPPIVSSFVTEFARRLRGRSTALTLPLTWLDQRLSESGLTIERLVEAENQLQAADQVSIANSIGSLRSIGATNWREFVETMSVVEQTLRQDPGDVYGRMDFATRDRYRHVVERVAMQSQLSESEVARLALNRALEVSCPAGQEKQGCEDRAAHVGFHLVDEGLPELEQTAGVHRSAAETLRRIGGRCPLFIYLSSILSLTILLTATALAAAQAVWVEPWLIALLGTLSLLGATHLAVALVNWLATLLAKPHTLARMDFSAGIPPDSRTLVVVPTMLTSASNIEILVEALEVRFLGNRDKHLHFGLLTDFRDAREEVTPEDEQLLGLACKGIEALNVKYGGETCETFFLFHRPRRWNAREGLWMGYERKRGKLAELNALLRGRGEDRFSIVVGRTAVLTNVKFVITLDTDTQLTRDAARQFAGAMAHPLNRPRYDESRHRICEGYGILQPRVGERMPAAARSRYALLCGGDPGIDPYTRAVSDVYQDLFHEGSFIGKGIYEVDAFERVLLGRFPENRILSHDLLEGCYARAGLLSDVELYEESPSRYAADVARRYRWIRGDWQIAAWILPRVPGPDGMRLANPLSLLSRWKIFDNLRRSLVPGALTLLLLLSWMVLPTTWFWTMAVVGALLIPPWTASLLTLLRKPTEVLPSQHFATALSSANRQFVQAAFGLACLPYEAYYSLDAILRTTARLLITRKRLLEWNPSSDAEPSSRVGLAADFRAMWVSPALAAVSLLYLSLMRPASLAVASPVLVLWFTSPLIAWWLSRPRPRNETQLSDDQSLFLRNLSRKTWGFFETFVGPEDHWLPPDNIQEESSTELLRFAHRTSPTNMGLALLANLAAYDFGYISSGRLIERTGQTLRTMNDLERYRGHFYNWYDTQSLQPLPPLYLSSVDSGNLAGHLLTLRPGIASLPEQRILTEQFFHGLADTLSLLLQTAGEGKDVAASGIAQLEMALLACDPLPATLSAAWLCVDRLATAAEVVSTSLSAGPHDPDSEDRRWAAALAGQCQDARDELLLFAPWAERSTSENSCEEIEGFVGLDQILTLGEVARLEARFASCPGPEPDTEPDQRARWAELQGLVSKGSQRARERLDTIERLAQQASALAHPEYKFLLDEAQQLLSIGYNVGERRLDINCYDLLASEARLTTFVAIAQGELSQECWFALGRLLTSVGGEPTLLSWSGSMFEYLMPLLVMPSYVDTLLDQTCRSAVARQIEYGEKCGVPWGISESGYNAIDVSLNYQYRAFGVPDLGLKRGLAEDLVVAPYAAALALLVAPEEACRNLERLTAEGFEGTYGHYEAIDYTPSRVPLGQESAVVRSYMSHHQGMSFLSLASLLLNRPMQKRFASDPELQATLLLLQERVPRPAAPYVLPPELSDARERASEAETAGRFFNTPHTVAPEVQLLSNGRYHVMVTNAGGGYSHWQDLAVTRWREDTTCDDRGTFCYLRDVTNGEFWSTAHQPTRKVPDSYEAIFSESRVEFRVLHNDFNAHTEIAVSPEDDIELRRITITNRAQTRRTIEVTSYSEVVLAPPAADALHPAFGNLFVQTEILHEHQAILCTRRPRSADEESPWMFHLMAVHGASVEGCSYETDRSRFLGRGNTVAAPQTLTGGTDLSGSEGSVLDPIVAIRRRITLDPEESATVNMVLGIGETRNACLGLVEKYLDRRLTDRVFELAWTHNQVVLQQINATEAEAQLYGRLASSILYGNARLRANTSVLDKNQRGQSGLWGYSISGDLPIVVLQIGDPKNIELARQLIRAHAYWSLKGLAVDLVIWTEDQAGYRQLLQEQILGLIAVGGEPHATDRAGGIFVRPGDQIPDEDRILFKTVARALLTDTRGTLAEQIGRGGAVADSSPPLALPRARNPDPTRPPAPSRTDLLFYNGIGGFTPDGHEYVITTTHDQVTPAPWVNVLANPEFGTVISESGSAYTWSENAHEFRLSPWENDPVSDGSGEVFYLRDEERGHVWSPTPLPARGSTPYSTRHGFGYSVFEHIERGIRSELWVYVATTTSVKFAVLKVHNQTSRSRRLSATGYVEWVLGDLRPKTVSHVVTQVDPVCGALFARNPYNKEFSGRVAFFDVDAVTRTVSGDRTEFLGRNGTLRSPAAMARTELSGRVGAGLDPCAAIQVPFELAAGQEHQLVFTLGVGRDTEDSRQLATRSQYPGTAKAELDAVWQQWNHTLGAVQVETPDPSLDVLTNGWLLYQTLACRLWARSGYYQSGGAFGFRDQLQDAMALVHADSSLLRKQLLLCAAHQFREGDVQHWWHPPSNRGVRTHCSDDYLWLPLATARYIAVTGDTGVLGEIVPFLDARPLNNGEESYYDLPHQSADMGSLYEHCRRAILHGLRFGEHGLPLIGSGDWNDGMNRVGMGGQGESVWLGFFLYDVLVRFTVVAEMHDDLPFAKRCQTEAVDLRGNIEQSGWDGEWYRRAYFDDGTPLGSAKSHECRIDSIAQSWSVLSGAGNEERSHCAMDAVDRLLVRRDASLVQLLDPPFDTSSLDPGYIKGYVPGVRENGGQYTHAAIWAAMAFATIGDAQRAWELTAMINPVNHGHSGADIATYKVEPYVMAADVYAVSPHTGQGGWSWYTGSAGWFYRLVIESLLGLQLDGDQLTFAPCLPVAWDSFKVHYRYRETLYHLTLRQTDGGAPLITMDGVQQVGPAIALIDDRREHTVEVSLPR